MPEPDTGPGAHDAGLAEIREQVDTLAAALAIWATRDDTRPQPDVRTAGTDAMIAIDRAVYQLNAMRNRLIDEIRARDDAAMARTEALLRKDREAGQ